MSLERESGEDAAGARVALIVPHIALHGELSRALELAGHEVVPVARDGRAGGDAAPTRPIDVWLVDPSGLDPTPALLDRLGARHDRIIWLAAAGPSPGSVASRGVTLPKPFSLPDLERAIADCRASAARVEGPLDPMLRTRDPGMTRVLERARRLARLDAPVVLIGELGSGRGALARAMHGWSPRGGEALVALEHAALASVGPEECARRVARAVERARWGALVLLEPADWPRAAQAALCAALRTEQGRPRCYAIVREALASRAEAGDLAVELLYRIDAAAIRIPAIRDRPVDHADLCAASGGRRRGSTQRSWIASPTRASPAIGSVSRVACVRP